MTPVTEFGQRDHVMSALVMVATQLCLTWWLWQALYADVPENSGLTAQAATTYAMLGVLYMRFRTVSRSANGDQMTQLMHEGTIAYWFLRPVRPQRYYLVRAVGDLGYGLLWAVPGYVVCRALGVVAPPASVAAGFAATATTALGLVILYYLQLVVDLVCFWTVVNDQAVATSQFLQNLLSGAFAPLWFFPDWFQSVVAWLPFQSTLHVPLSLYVGRLPVASTGHHLAVQAFWCVTLAAAARLMWHGAAARVTVLGG